MMLAQIVFISGEATAQVIIFAFCMRCLLFKIKAVLLFKLQQSLCRHAGVQVMPSVWKLFQHVHCATSCCQMNETLLGQEMH